jgi:hypothetical protein
MLTIASIAISIISVFYLSIENIHIFAALLDANKACFGIILN